MRGDLLPSIQPGVHIDREMSSGFVSAGSLERSNDQDEWKKAQQELDEGRKKKLELENKHGGKSLYAVLQENQGG